MICRHSLRSSLVSVPQILRKPDGSSRGFGFVTYSDDMSVEQVLQLAHEINGTAVNVQTVWPQ